MKILLTFFVTFFAGMGAGLGTGFAGMSAAAVISPMLITFLGMVIPATPDFGKSSPFPRTCWPAPYPLIPIRKMEIWM